MAIKKNILVDGIEVPFKASAAVPRLYRLKFGRDIYRDFAALQSAVEESEDEDSDEKKTSALSIESLEVSRTWRILWQNTLTLRMFLITLMIFWSSSTHSASTRFFHSSLTYGD